MPVLCVPTISLILDHTCPHSPALFWLQRQLINTMLYLSTSLRYLYQSIGRSIQEHLGNIRNHILWVTLHMLSQRNQCKLMGRAYLLIVIWGNFHLIVVWIVFMDLCCILVLHNSMPNSYFTMLLDVLSVFGPCLLLFRNEK